MIACERLDVHDEGPDLRIVFRCAHHGDDREHDVALERAPRSERRRHRSGHGPLLVPGAGPVERLRRVRLDGTRVALVGDTLELIRDCAAVPGDEWRRMQTALERMNFDRCFELVTAAGCVPDRGPDGP